MNGTSRSYTDKCYPNRHDQYGSENLAGLRDRVWFPKDKVSTVVAQALAVAGSKPEPPPETQPITCNIPERLLLLVKDFLIAGLILKIV
jgi:hypothetical protein